MFLVKIFYISGLAWVAIFVVISLEGWTDVMYLIQDVHSFYNFVYFVVLIIVTLGIIGFFIKVRCIHCQVDIDKLYLFGSQQSACIFQFQDIQPMIVHKGYNVSNRDESGIVSLFYISETNSFR